MASVLTYPLPAFNPAIPQPYSHFAGYHNGATTISPASSPVVQAFPKYDAYTSISGGRSAYQSSGALAAAQAAGDSGQTSRLAARKAKTTTKRRSFGRSGTTQPGGSVETTPSTSSRTTTKEKFKTNMKKVGSQKGDPATTLDLSMTAEENERRTGIPLQSASSRMRSATDVPFVSVSRQQRNNTIGYGAPSASFKPSSPFVLPTHAGSRPQTPHSAYHSHANSTVNSEFSVDHFDITRQSSAPASERPSLRINTSSEVGSIRSLTRKRRNTNQSSASGTTPTSKPRKSLDKAFGMVRRDSSATEDMMDPATRVASIRAARQAFEEREEKKDAKYEKRAERNRERQEQKQQRKTGSGRSRAGSSAVKNSSNLHLSEKADYVGSKPYDDLPVPGPSSRPRTGPGLLPEIPKFSRKRHMKNKYASFLSWLRTKILNLGRRRAKAKAKA